MNSSTGSDQTFERSRAGVDAELGSSREHAVGAAHVRIPKRGRTQRMTAT